MTFSFLMNCLKPYLIKWKIVEIWTLPRTSIKSIYTQNSKWNFDYFFEPKINQLTPNSIQRNNRIFIWNSVDKYTYPLHKFEFFKTIKDAYSPSNTLKNGLVQFQIIFYKNSITENIFNLKIAPEKVLKKFSVVSNYFNFLIERNMP